MTARTKLLAIEGIDGSGKRTQLDLLSRALRRRGIEHVRVSFPRYSSFFGRMVGQFLDGDFGPLEKVDAHFSALLYAADRLEARPELERALAAGKLILADRYIGSNLAHQTARVSPARRGEFLRWLRQLEYGVFGLPRESLVIYLRVPARTAQRLVGRKAARAYTRRERDILEASLAHLRQAARVYENLAKARNWAVVQCIEPTTGELLTPDAIHRAVMATIARRAGYLLRGGRKR
jgi:dTMP kinase